MFGTLRCGCYAVLVLAAVLLCAAAVVFWLITRDIGPAYRDGAYTVQTASGASRVDHITPEAAARFEAKVPAPTGTLDVSRIGPTDLVRLKLSGISFSEEEVNSELARRLAAKPVNRDGIAVDRLFLELHAQDSRAYLYTRVYGVKMTFSARVVFSVQNQQARATLSDIHAGKMPIGFILPSLLDWTGNTAALENRLALALPSQVTAVQTKEGELHVDIDPLRFGRAAQGLLGGLAATAAGVERRLLLPGGSLGRFARVSGRGLGSRQIGSVRRDVGCLGRGRSAGGVFSDVCGGRAVFGSARAG